MELVRVELELAGLHLELDRMHCASAPNEPENPHDRACP